MTMNNSYNNLVSDKPKVKPLIESRTFWVNVATAAVAVIVTLGGTDLIQNNPQVAGFFAAVIPVVNVLLRLITKDPVSVLGK
jgi:hypothetical protein